MNYIGEVFKLSNNENNCIDYLTQFNGRKIKKLTGGIKRLFVIEEINNSENYISSLHNPIYDQFDFTITSDNLHLFHKKDLEKLGYFDDNNDNIEESEENINKYYNEENYIENKEINENTKKEVNDFDLINKNELTENIEINSKKGNQDQYDFYNENGYIIDIKSGKQFLLILNDSNKVYSYGYGEYGIWGHGSSIYIKNPLLIKKLDRYKVVSISCGYYHSLALIDSGNVFAWGNSFNGQCGKMGCSSFPEEILFFRINKIRYIECGSTFSLAISKEKDILYSWGEGISGQLGNGCNKNIEIPQQIMENINSVKAGYCHSVALDNNGDLYTWGLNKQYQLGIDKILSYSNTPIKLEKDYYNSFWPKFKTIFASGFRNFAIDINGKIFSWGTGALGLKNTNHIKTPKKLEGIFQERQIENVFCNEDNTLLFCKLKINSIKPNCGPSQGGTILNIIGLGLCDANGKQKGKFIFDKYEKEVNLKYNETTNSYFCITPNFDSVSIYDLIEWPQISKFYISWDGENYMNTNLEFLIYSNKIKCNNMNPKFVSCEGGIKLKIELSQKIEQKFQQKFQYLSICFQKSNNLDESEEFLKKNQNINLMNLDTSNPEINKENWKFIEATFVNNKIVCLIPEIENKESNIYNVDISLNGQQLLGSSLTLKYYNIKILNLYPNNSIFEGGAKINIEGEGFFDTPSKKIKIKNSLIERLIDIKWDKELQSFYFYTPPINWLIGTENEEIKLIDQIKNKNQELYITLSGIEWVFAGNYIYYEPKITKLNIEISNKKYNWNDEEFLKLTEKGEEVDIFEGLNQKEIDKKEKEIQKNIIEEKYLLENIIREPLTILYIRGEDFKEEEINVIFKNNLKLYKTKGYFINKTRILTLIPEIESNKNEIINLNIGLSFNKQQNYFSEFNLKYYLFKKEVLDNERVKLIEEHKKLEKKNKK